MMDRNAVIIITGAAGFIGSCLTGYLNRKGYYNIIIVDDFDDETKKHNYDEKKICARVDKEELFDWLTRYQIRIDFVFHLGAYIQPAGSDYTLLHKKNSEYSKKIWQYCTDKKIPLVYASFDEPVQPAGTGEMLNRFDDWVNLQYNEKKSAPPFWAGLYLSHVYGPNEYHKGADASLVFRFFEQVMRERKIKLRNLQDDNSPVYDFIYVKDVVDVCYWLMQKNAGDQDQPQSGFYDVGSGLTHSFEEVAGEIFKCSGKEPALEYAAVSDKVQQPGMILIADISRLREAGYKKEFYSLAEGIRTYITHFLAGNKYY
jgi:ADP-L-glycero-D-manno-heptose 6-epimerase